MIDKKTENLILQGYFNPMCSKIAEKTRNQYVVNRIGTFDSTQVIHSELDGCKNHGAYWTWGDNKVTVVDIRAK